MYMCLEWFISGKFYFEIMYAYQQSPTHATCHAHHILLDLITRITLCGVRTMKLINMQSSSVSCDFLLPRKKYHPQQPT
jgi:hypothetical protein